MFVSKVNSVHIEVRCAENVPESVSAGGPVYLGFDFFVKKESAEFLKEMIRIKLRNENIPCKGIYCYESYSPATWDLEKILDDIEEKMQNFTN